MASYLHRTAQPSTLATFRSWGSLTGAGRIRLAAANIRVKSFRNFVSYFFLEKIFIELLIFIKCNQEKYKAAAGHKR